MILADSIVTFKKMRYNYDREMFIGDVKYVRKAKDCLNNYFYDYCSIVCMLQSEPEKQL